jgi:hypothetical protein
MTDISDAARRLNSLRKHRRGGRPKKPTQCPRCKHLCKTATEARQHCKGRQRVPPNLE